MQHVFAVYKPKGPTSHDVVNEIRKITGVRRVGHAGTLDPLASGVLVVGVGRDATRTLGRVLQEEKEYIARIKLGEESVTDDAEGEKTVYKVSVPPTRHEVEDATSKFCGNILQMTPIYSAAKVRGKRSYKHARQGRPLSPGARQVEIKEIEILKYEWPYLTLRVVTGSGVYIRALARDIGRELKTGGYLFELERTRVGEFTKDKVIQLRDLAEFWKTKEKVQ
ncbi:MAG: tRNA pseudouridine(55) synthase TruB [Patescibacteria group bacterium]|nr:tRNA pseudouridine(55) synthase TruB [Patescibacteria group bacterium]